MCGEMIRPETDTEKVAALFEGLQDIHVSRNPVLKQVYVSRKQTIPVKRNFWQWLLRMKIEAYLETTVTLDITKDGFIRYRLRNLEDITILKEMIAPVLDRNDVFMLVELPPTCENIDFEKIPGIAYLYP